MLNEKFGFSMTQEPYATNAIWQCPEVLSVQAECMVEDNRNCGTQEPFTVFYIIDDEDNWKRELTRILRSLGFELCAVKNHFVRKITLDAFVLYGQGKPLED